MLAGSDGLLGIQFDFPWIAHGIGVIALAFILFSGGLETSWHEVRPVLRPGLALASVGVLITALSVGWFTSTFLGFTLTEGILLGAIIAATDAAAVFSVLRGNNVRLKGKLTPLLEMESGSNDPMAVFLTIGMIELITYPEQPVTSLIPLFVMQMGIGLVMGIVAGRVMVFLINRLRLEYDGLYPVLTVALVLLTYSVTALLHGNSFLAVYVAGVVVAQRDFIHRRSLIQFHSGVAWLMQIVMFVTLGLQVFPSRLFSVIFNGLLVTLFLIFIARPLSVFLALAFERFNVREKLFISWVGLRGAAPIVLATFPLLAGVEKSDMIFHLVFFIVLTSVLLQGTLIVPMAKWLRVYDSDTPPPQSPLELVTDDSALANDLLEITVPQDSPARGRRLLDLGLPKDVLVMLIGRGDQMVVPRGDTLIHAGDKVLLWASENTRQQVRQKLEGDKVLES